MRLVTAGCRIETGRGRSTVDVVTDTAAGLADLSPQIVDAVCEQWLLSDKARFFPRVGELRDMAMAKAPPPMPEPAHQPWHRWAEVATGTLANCFISRIGQLEPADKQRFGRDLADHCKRWPLMELHQHGREIEQWACEWLGVTWAELIGPKPEQVYTGKGAWQAGS